MSAAARSALAYAVALDAEWQRLNPTKQTLDAIEEAVRAAADWERSARTIMADAERVAA